MLAWTRVWGCRSQFVSLVLSFILSLFLSWLLLSSILSGVSSKIGRWAMSWINVRDVRQQFHYYRTTLRGDVKECQEKGEARSWTVNSVSVCTASRSLCASDRVGWTSFPDFTLFEIFLSHILKTFMFTLWME